MVGFDDAQLVALLPRVRRYALVLTRSVDRADDLVQQVAVRALEKRHLFQEGTDLGAWLGVLTHNAYVNGVRYATRASCVDLDAAGHVPAADDPSVGAELSEVIENLRRLPRPQQRLIIAAALTDDNYEELAAFEDVPSGTIRSRLSRGRDALRLMSRGVELSRDERERVASA
jgi:RNA polymerase sigma-70 factor, ECF subfamily